MASGVGHEIGIIVHGCHLQAQGTGYDWHSLVFGTPEEPGRVPTALELMYKVSDVKLVFWGTGASFITLEDGSIECESEHTYRMATTVELPWMAERIGRRAGDVLQDLMRISYIDTKTQNTTEEVRCAFQICGERGIAFLYSVSSPSHIQRCLGTLMSINQETSARLLCFATASVTDFGGAVVLEAPHRWDRLKPKEESLYPNHIARKIFGFMADFSLYAEYLDRWRALTDEYAQRFQTMKSLEAKPI